MPRLVEAAVSMRGDINRAATTAKAAKSGFHDPDICSICGGKPAIFVWRRRGFCRLHKVDAYDFAKATPMPTREVPP